MLWYCLLHLLLLTTWLGRASASSSSPTSTNSDEENASCTTTTKTTTDDDNDDFKSFPRSELDDMMQRWIAANDAAEQAGNWSALADFYTPDAVYSWNMGPNREMVATGRDEIRRVALGWFMQGFERWKYPYHDVIIDDQRGAVVAFWDHVAPAQRADGTAYRVVGLSGSRFQYAGNYQWKWQKDFFDMQNVMALTMELAGAGELDAGIKEKMRNQVQGKPMPLVRSIRPEEEGMVSWLYNQAKQLLAVLKILIFGS